MTGKFKRVLTPLAILLVGLMLIFVVATMKPKPEPLPAVTAPLIDVRVMTAVPASTRLSVKTQGTVMPRREVDLVSQVAGKVVAVADNFVAGGFVSPDEVLVQIDARDYELSVIRSKARVADAEQLLAVEKGRSRQAKKEWRNLDSDDANALFLRQPQLKFAKAQLQSSMAERDQAQLNVERTQLSVPFAGRIRETMVELGQYVTVGSQIAQVYDSAVVEIRLPLTDRQAALIDIPMAQTRVGNLSAVIISASVAGRAQSWAGQIVRSDATVDTRSRFYYVVAEVDNSNVKTLLTDTETLPLMIGLFVDAEITGREIADVLTLPKTALFKGRYLFSVDDNNQIRERAVTVLHSDADTVWIAGAALSGERVVLDKQILLTDGMSVNVTASSGVADSVEAIDAQLSAQ